MSTSKHFDKICCIVMALALLITVVFINGESLGLTAAARTMGYEDRLFDHTKVHTIDIVADNWEDFLATCTDEEYIQCAAVIDGESYKNIAIRAKGNTSLSSVQSYGNDRYSFKLEFDHFDSTNTYHGLDKLCLNNIIQDNTYMKDFLVYQMMLEYGAKAPLCSFAYITVNGKDWGLYLAVEAVEDSFLRRNYGNDYGELYKPDSLSMGGGRGNGKDFNMEDFPDSEDNFIPAPPSENSTSPDGQYRPYEHNRSGQRNEGGFGQTGMGGSDVKLQYIDDDPTSYSAIFDSAKTDITEGDERRLIQALKQLSQQDISAINVEDVIRYFVVHNFVCNGDSYTGSMIHNYYLYEENGVLSMLPWDYNLAFGGFDGSNATAVVNSPIDTPVSGGIGEDRPMIYWIFSDERYTSLYHEYFNQFIAECMNSGLVTELIDSTAALIAPYVEKDPTKFCSYDEFTAGTAALREFCALRTQSVNRQLDGSIPSTTDGQADNAALVDASHLELSDMGSMDFGGIGGRHNGADPQSSFGRFGNNLSPPAANGSSFADDEQFIPPSQAHQGMMPPQGFGEAPPNDFGTGGPPENATAPQEGRGYAPAVEGNASAPAQDYSEAPPTNLNEADLPENISVSQYYTWLGGCALLLIIGIVVAWIYKR